MLAALSTADTIIAIVIAVAAVRGAFKGAAWTIVRFVGFIAALAAAIAWYPGVGAWLDQRIDFIPEKLAYLLAFLGILILVWLIATYFAWVARGAVKRVKLGGIDRPLGFVAGGALGLLLTTVAFLILGNNAPGLAKDWLEGSVAAPYMRMVVETIEPALPENLRAEWQNILDGLDHVPMDEPGS